MYQGNEVSDGGASYKQVQFICNLLERKDLSSLCPRSADVEAWKKDRKHEAANVLSKGKASEWIDILKPLPDRNVNHSTRGSDNSGADPLLNRVPDGRYAIETNEGVKFYRIKNGTCRVFVDVQASSDLWPIKTTEIRTEIIETIEADPSGASIRYGRELGRCGVCGRTLTDETSRKNGIGPICADKVGF